MDQVKSRLDRRFSGPGAEATPWHETERLPEAAQLFWISTVATVVPI